MSILLLIFFLLFGWWSAVDIGSDTVVSGPVAAPTPVMIEEAPPLPTVVSDPVTWADPAVFADVAFVQVHLGDPTIKVVALTPEDEFSAGHIPGAIQVDWKPFEIVETDDQQVATWRAEVEGLLTGLFISPTDTVVIYDGGTLYASRLWWVLDQLGHERKLILNGGLTAWEATGGPVDVGPAPEGIRDPPVPYVGTPNEAAIATIAEVEAALGDPNVVLVDARTPEEYAAGHIPGAVNIPFTDNAVDGSGGLWKSPEELRAMYEVAGVTEDMTVIPYCLTGVRSAATYVTLTALGYPNVSLFTGSWAEWSADPERPVEV